VDGINNKQQRKSSVHIELKKAAGYRAEALAEAGTGADDETTRKETWLI
jgi:hypothetical protein